MDVSNLVVCAQSTSTLCGRKYWTWWFTPSQPVRPMDVSNLVFYAQSSSTWHTSGVLGITKTFLVQLYRHLAIKLYCIVLYCIVHSVDVKQHWSELIVIHFVSYIFWCTLIVTWCVYCLYKPQRCSTLQWETAFGTVCGGDLKILVAEKNQPWN